MKFGIHEYINMYIIFDKNKMNRLIFRSSRALFSTLPEAKALEISSEKAASSRIQKLMEEQTKIAIAQNQEMINKAHDGLDLNFSVEQDGKTPVLVAKYQTRINPYEVASYGFSAYFLYGLVTATSSYVALAGAFAAVAWSATQAAGTIAARSYPKISRIDLLNDGSLEITTHGEAEKSFTIQKSQFEYSVSFSPITSVIASHLSREGVWCKIDGRTYLIPSNHRANQHLLNEIL